MLASLTSTIELQKAVQKGKIIVLDFSAIWCGPCRAMKPILEQLSNDYKDVDFYLVDLDLAEPELVDMFGVQALPTIKIIKNGSVVYTMIGAKPQELFEVLNGLVL